MPSRAAASAAADSGIYGDAEVTKTSLASPSSNNNNAASDCRSTQARATKVIGMLSSARPRKRKGSSTVLAIGASRKQGPAPPTSAVSAEEENLQEHGKQGNTVTVSNSSSTALVLTTQQQEQAPSSRKDHLPLHLVPPVIPQNTTGQPSLKAFCIAYPRRKKMLPSKRKNDNRKQNQSHGDNLAISPLTVNNAAKLLTLPNQQNHHQQQPTVQIINGEIVLQESSVVFHGVGAGTHASDDDHPQTNNSNSMTIVEEESEMAVVRSSYQSYATGKRACRGTHHWSVEETQLFYEALRQVGVDFGCMEAYFNSPQQGPSKNNNNLDDDNNNNTSVIRQRNRRQLKNKYAAELKRNPRLVERALHAKGRVEIDLSVFELTPEQVEEMAAQQKQQQGEKEQQQEKGPQEPVLAKEIDQSEQMVFDELIGSEDDNEENLKLPAKTDACLKNFNESFWRDNEQQQPSNNNSNNPIGEVDPEDDDDVVEDPGFAEDDSSLFFDRAVDVKNHPQAEGTLGAAATAAAPFLPTLVHKKNIAKPAYRASAAVARKKQKK